MVTTTLATPLLRDFIRRPTAVDADQGFWEWLHFAIRAPGNVDVVLNLCTAADPRPELAAPSWFGCATVLVHTDRWVGDTLRYDAREVKLGAGRIWACMGESVVRHADGKYSIHTELPRLRVRIDLELTPVGVGTSASGVRLPAGRSMSWHVVPRLIARGVVEIEGHAHRLHGALGYHDHNWGRIGDADLSWEWGYAHPRRPDATESVFFVRLMDRARCTTHMQGVFVWRDGLPVRLFRDRSVRFVRQGVLPLASPVVPRLCSLLLPPVSWELPASLAVEGASQDDEVLVRFETLDAARIAVPQMSDEQLLVIHEVRATARLRGRVADVLFEEEADGFFELVAL
jgi:hypothetical protein